MDKGLAVSGKQSGGDSAPSQLANVASDAGQNRWLNALEAAQQGVWDQSLVNDEVYYSPVWYRMRGYEPDADLDNSLEGWLLRVHLEDREHVRTTIQQQNLTRSDNSVFEYRERHAKGHYIWIQSRGRPVAWDENGKATRTLGTDTDITRQKQLEMDVVTERQRLRVMLGSIADAVIATDTAGLITYMNPSASSLVLRVEEDCLGQHIDKVFTLFTDDMSPVYPLQECQPTEARWENKNLTLRVYRSISKNVRCVVSALEQSHGRTEGFVVVLEDVSLSRQLERRLAFLANHDTLTRLPNRHAFEAAIEKALTAARDNDVVFSLCCLDLDRFKQINDSLGHAAGDYALQQVVVVMNQWKLPFDYIARVGGDEFVILMRDTSAHVAEQRMAALEHAIDNMNGIFEGQPFELGLSFGIAQIRGSSVGADQVLRLADSRCYAHKSRVRSGKRTRVADFG
jgi:diguanylate cyclase